MAGRTLLVFDLDGTLAPLAQQPHMASLPAPTRRLLSAVAARYPTAVLTGRDRRDAARILRGVPLRMIVGNHGLDLGGASAKRTVAAWSRQLTMHRRGLQGILLERKKLSITAHYRSAIDPVDARRRCMRVARGLVPPPRIVPGKASVNLLPDIGLDKGTALRNLMRRFKARSAIYVGDDDTDEDAFTAGNASGVLTVRVGRSRHTAAQYLLPSQLQMNALLERLLSARTRSRRERGGATQLLRSRADLPRTRRR